MFEFILKCDGVKLSCQQADELTTGSSGVANCVFAFDENWDGFIKTAIFFTKDDYLEMIIDENNSCRIPAKAITEEGINVGVVGVSAKNQMLSSTVVRLDTLDGTYINTDYVPEQSIWEQYLLKMSTSVQEAKVYAQTAQSAELNPPYIGENKNWFVYDMTSQAYKDSGVCAKGIQGETGTQGNQGIQGDKGEAGEDGKSAYQIACEKGFSGTEEEWIASLKGKDGDSGHLEKDFPTLVRNLFNASVSLDPQNKTISYADKKDKLGNIAALDITCESTTVTNIMAPSNTATTLSFIQQGLIAPNASSGKFDVYLSSLRSIFGTTGHYYYVCLNIQNELTPAIKACFNELRSYYTGNLGYTVVSNTIKFDETNHCIYGVVPYPYSVSGNMKLGFRNADTYNAPAQSITVLSEIVVDIGTVQMTPEAAYAVYGNTYFTEKISSSEYNIVHSNALGTLETKAMDGSGIYLFTPDPSGSISINGTIGMQSIRFLYNKDNKNNKYCILKDNILTIINKYTQTNDLYISLKKKGVNNLFDFYEGGLIPNTNQTVSTQIGSNATVLFKNNNDWFGAFHMTAKQNADGDDLTGGTLTGGAHSYANTQEGVATARCTSLAFWVDDIPVTEFEGYFDKLRIVWSNNVQATNTKKADGTGREVLTEKHELLFDGEKFNVWNDIMPMENINMNTYYSFQACLTGFLGSLNYMGGTDTNRATLNSTDNTNSTSHDCYMAVSKKDGNCLEVGIDPIFDLGTRTHTLATNPGMFCDGSKIRTHLIYDYDMTANNHYYSRGHFRFFAE